MDTESVGFGRFLYGWSLTNQSFIDDLNKVRMVFEIAHEHLNNTVEEIYDGDGVETYEIIQIIGKRKLIVARVTDYFNMTEVALSSNDVRVNKYLQRVLKNHCKYYKRKFGDNTNWVNYEVT